MLLIRTDTHRSTTVSSTDDHVLNGCTIYKQRTYDFLSCAQLCLARPNCMSFNYENIENGVCELNRDATDGSIVVALTTRTGYTFGQFLNISVSIDHLLCHSNWNHRANGFFPLTIGQFCTMTSFYYNYTRILGFVVFLRKLRLLFFNPPAGLTNFNNKAKPKWMLVVVVNIVIVQFSY